MKIINHQNFKKVNNKKKEKKIFFLMKISTIINKIGIQTKKIQYQANQPKKRRKKGKK